MQTVKEQCGTALSDKEKEYQSPEPKPVYEACKRIFDVVMSAIALIVLSPVFLVTAIAIKLEDGGPAFYVSTRLTKNAKEFRMYKFRSMFVNADQHKQELADQNEVNGPAFKMKNDPRITKVGKFIRKTSIDELPQLLNILKGDMSIIGPRPPLPEEFAQYTPYQKHRLDVLTGLACYHECEGRSDETEFDLWVESDLRYIRERSMLTDLKVIFMTIKVVLTGSGAM